MQCKQAVMADEWQMQMQARARAGRQAKQGKTATGPQSPVQHRTSRPQDEREGPEKEVQEVMH